VNLFHGRVSQGRVRIGAFELPAPDHAGAHDAPAIGDARPHDLEVVRDGAGHGLTRDEPRDLDLRVGETAVLRPCAMRVYVNAVQPHPPRRIAERPRRQLWIS
jgi:hypothetical protein